MVESGRNNHVINFVCQHLPRFLPIYDVRKNRQAFLPFQKPWVTIPLANAIGNWTKGVEKAAFPQFNRQA